MKIFRAEESLVQRRKGSVLLSIGVWVSIGGCGYIGVLGYIGVWGYIGWEEGGASAVWEAAPFPFPIQWPDNRSKATTGAKSRKFTSPSTLRT